MNSRELVDFIVLFRTQEFVDLYTVAEIVIKTDMLRDKTVCAYRYVKRVIPSL